MEEREVDAVEAEASRAAEVEARAEREVQTRRWLDRIKDERSARDIELWRGNCQKPSSRCMSVQIQTVRWPFSQHIRKSQSEGMFLDSMNGGCANQTTRIRLIKIRFVRPVSCKYF